MTREHLADATVFLREFVRAPLLTASVAPSSRVLAERIAAPVPARGDPVVVELGPGTGTITSAIQRRLGGRGRHLAVELNARLAAVAQQRHPDVEVICADVAELPGILAERRLTADSRPVWRNLPPALTYLAHRPRRRDA